MIGSSGERRTRTSYVSFVKCYMDEKRRVEGCTDGKKRDSCVRMKRIGRTVRLKFVCQIMRNFRRIGETRHVRAVCTYGLRSLNWTVNCEGLRVFRYTTWTMRIAVATGLGTEASPRIFNVRQRVFVRTGVAESIYHVPFAGFHRYQASKPAVADVIRREFKLTLQHIIQPKFV